MLLKQFDHVHTDLIKQNVSDPCYRSVSSAIDG